MTADVTVEEPVPSFDLTGQVAIVTGAARGLGRASALALAAAGATVALGLRDIDADQGLTAELRRRGATVLPVQMDVTDLRQSYRGVDDVVAELGGVDILENNAGGGIADAAADVTEKDFDAVFDLNVRSTFFLSQYVGRTMIERGHGRIVKWRRRPGSSRCPARSGTAWRRRPCCT